MSQEHAISSYSPAEVMHMFDISEATIRRWVASGRLTKASVGRGLRIAAEGVDAERLRRLDRLGAGGTAPSDAPVGEAMPEFRTTPVTVPLLDECREEVQRLKNVVAALLASEQAQIDALRELTQTSMARE